MPKADVIPAFDIERLIYTVRGQRVILDTDLAKIYGVETRSLNQAVRRNLQRFPADFLIRLTDNENSEIHALRSQFVILKPGRGQHRKFPSLAFTEHGAFMAASLLNSPRAIAMSVYVIRAFVRMREEMAANVGILKRLAEIEKTLVIHDVTLRDILQKLRPLLEPPPTAPKPQIGFHVKEEAIPYRIKRKFVRT